MINTAQLFTIILNGISFMAAFAAIAGTLIMFQVTNKFGSGIIANGFKTIGSGVLFLAVAIIMDVLNWYLQLAPGSPPAMVLYAGKGTIFVTGMYIIVIGSKKIIDNLEKAGH